MILPLNEKTTSAEQDGSLSEYEINAWSEKLLRRGVARAKLLLSLWTCLAKTMFRWNVDSSSVPCSTTCHYTHTEIHLLRCSTYTPRVCEPRQTSNVATEEISDNITQYCGNDKWPVCNSEVTLRTRTMAPTMLFPNVIHFTEFIFCCSRCTKKRVKNSRLI